MSPSSSPCYSLLLFLETMLGLQNEKSLFFVADDTVVSTLCRKILNPRETIHEQNVLNLKSGCIA
jgi:hypothetical protein